MMANKSFGAKALQILRRNPYLILFLLAFIPRILLFLGSFILSKYDLNRIFLTADANSYFYIIEKICGNISVRNKYDERVFPGWPVTLLIFSKIMNVRYLSILLGILFSSLVPVLFYKMSQNLKTSVLLAFLTPTFLVHSINGMSEPVFMFYILMSIAFFTQGKHKMAAIFIAFASLVRPMALFPWVGMFFVLFYRKQFKELIWFCVISGMVAGLIFPFNYYTFNDSLQQFHSYSSIENVDPAIINKISNSANGSHFGLPFVNIVKAVIYLDIPIWKLVFISSHIVFILTSLFLGFKYKVYRTNLGLILLIWSILNSLFIFSTGEYWAFYSFDRYLTWALPAYLYLFIKPFRLKPNLILVLYFLSFLVAAFGSWKPFV